MAVELNKMEEKVFQYLAAHKNPTTPKKLAKYFIRSESHIGAILRKLVEAGIADEFRIGTSKLYTIKQ